MRSRIAWWLAGVTAVLVVADAVVTAQYRPLFSEATVAVHGFPFVDLAVLGSAVMGALIIGRDARHPIGWILILTGCTSALSLLTEAYAIWVVSEDGPGPRSLGGVAGWLSTLVGGQLAIAGLALMFLLAPDGHLLSRRWRYAAGIAVLGWVQCCLAIVTTPPTTFDLVTAPSTVGPVRSGLLNLGFLFILVGLLSSLASMLLRLHRSRGEQRQQLRLVALSAAMLSTGLVWLVVVQALNGGEQTWTASMPLYASYMLLPVLFAVAVLRYRLYDVSIIINRTIVLAVAAVFAAAGYTTLVVVVGRVVDRRTSGFWLSLLATVLVAMAFQPLRRSVVRLANRMAYGSLAQPYEALADFSARLAETPDPDTLLPAIANAAGRAVSARRAVATLTVGRGDDLTAAWGADPDGSPSYVVPVTDGALSLGSIEVFLPPGRALRTSERRLLSALADHAAVAFRNRALERQLADHVSELDATTEALARSRARIVDADDAARRDLESAIAREVLPSLAGIQDDLGTAREAVLRGAPDNGLDLLVERTNAALEALRELTRGVFPTQLERSGLEPALRSLLTRDGRGVTLQVDPDVRGRRFPPRLETAVYLCFARAVQGGAGVTSVELSTTGADLLVRITGEVTGAALQGIRDRVEAAAGSVVAGAGGIRVSVPTTPAPASTSLAGGARPDL